MKTITQYREEIAALMAEVDRIFAHTGAENRNPSPDEQEKIAGNLAQIEENERLIAMLDKAEHTKTRLNEPVTAPSKPNPRSAITMPDRPQDKFPTFGEFLVKCVNAHNGGSVDPRLIKGAATGLGESIPSDGGFLVQQDFVNDILKRSYSTSVVAQRCRQIPISANANSLKIPGIDEGSRVDGSRWGGVRGYWLNEADAKTASKPKFRAIELNLNKLAALCYTTDELLMDASALEAVISQALTEELAFKLDDAIINGTGAGMPLGIYNSPCLVSVSKEAGQPADTVVFENIVKMYSRMWAPSRQNAAWFINQDVEPQLFGMGMTIGTAGAPVYLPPGGISGLPYGTIFGRPVIPIEQCQTVGDLGDIYFGDFSQYILATKGGIESAMSIHVRFVYDESVFRFVMRVDGQPTWNTTLTPFKGSNTQSPFIALAARA